MSPVPLFEVEVLVVVVEGILEELSKDLAVAVVVASIVLGSPVQSVQHILVETVSLLVCAVVPIPLDVVGWWLACPLKQLELELHESMAGAVVVVQHWRRLQC